MHVTSKGSDDSISFDNVSKPRHYMEGRQFEPIDVIEDFCQFAPEVRQGIALGQVLKYLSRVWTKGEPIENIRKAQWYLDRLADQMTPPPKSPDVIFFGGDPEDVWNPYNHPDVLSFGNDYESRVGLKGGLIDDDISKYRDTDFFVDVDGKKDTWTA
jgi:hypothetical protein